MSTIEGTDSRTELLSIATNVRTTVVPAMIARGSAQRTDSLIVPTSRVTRVTRSPELAVSTRDSGSRRMARTTYSRADARTSWPRNAELTWAAKVISPWTTTMPPTSSAMELAAAIAASWRPACTSATVLSTRPPRRRGMSRPAPAARALPSTTATTMSLRSVSRPPMKRTTLLVSAMGRPLRELSVSATNSCALRSRSR